MRRLPLVIAIFGAFVVLSSKGDKKPLDRLVDHGSHMDTVVVLHQVFRVDTSTKDTVYTQFMESTRYEDPITTHTSKPLEVGGRYEAILSGGFPIVGKRVDKTEEVKKKPPISDVPERPKPARIARAYPFIFILNTFNFDNILNTLLDAV